MRTGAKTFADLSMALLPALLIALYMGFNGGALGLLVGLFFALKFCNALDARDIRDGRG